MEWPVIHPAVEFLHSSIHSSWTEFEIYSRKAVCVCVFGSVAPFVLQETLWNLSTSENVWATPLSAWPKEGHSHSLYKWVKNSEWCRLCSNNHLEIHIQQWFYDVYQQLCLLSVTVYGLIKAPSGFELRKLQQIPGPEFL